jgi:hypothetical protein
MSPVEARERLDRFVPAEGGKPTVEEVLHHVFKRG